MTNFQFRLSGWLMATVMTVLAPAWTWADGERSELLEERDVYSKTFDNFDGSRTLHYGLEPLHYRPAGGEEMIEIDPGLQAGEGWVNTTNSFATRLPATLGDGAFVELGDGELRWRPGVLRAHTLTGEEIAVAEAAPAWGQRWDAVENGVVYPDLYPGIDLQAELRPGSLAITLTFREWHFELAPEQIERFSVEADLEVAGHWLEAFDERLAAGETIAEVPLVFGRSDDDWVIAMVSQPAIPEEQLLEYQEALVVPGEGEEPVPSPESWRSNAADWFDGGRVRHYVEHPVADRLSRSWGTTEAALTASFEFTEKQVSRTRRFFAATFDPALFNSNVADDTFAHTMRCDLERFKSCRSIANYLLAGRGADNEFFRTVVSFRSMAALQRDLRQDPTLAVKDIRLGVQNTFFRGPGMVSTNMDEVVAYSLLPWMFKDGWTIKIQTMPVEMPDPYNQELRSVTGGTIKTSTWSPWSSQGIQRTIGGEGFSFGSLVNTASGSSRRAISDLRRLLFNHDAGMTLLLAMPYDRTPCSLCTANHWDPAVQALNGEYRVGIGMYDLRLEITLEETLSQQAAELAATSVGNHNDRLYPGATRAWDLELTSLTSSSSLELVELAWDAAHFDTWFSDPASGAALTSPSLGQVGEKARLHLRWKRSDPALYGKTRKLVVSGSFRNGSNAAGVVEIPVELRAPEGSPAVAAIYPVVDDNISAPMGFATIALPSSGLQGAAYAIAELRPVSGPTNKLVRGTHWDVWSTASTSSDGELVIYPDQFQVGVHQIEVLPCLLPDGLPAAAHCLPAKKRQLSLEVRQASSSGAVRPQIDFVAPWSIDSPSGGAATLTAWGVGLGGAKVTIPQVVTNTAALSGSTANQARFSVNLSQSGICGPRQFQLTTPVGADAFVFNVTKPFQGNPNHFAIEAEAGVRRGLKIATVATASSGRAVVAGASGATGDLNLFLAPPVTSLGYRIFVLYRTPGQKPARARLELTDASANVVRSFGVSLPPTGSKGFALAVLRDVRATASTSFGLTAGRGYRLRLATVAGQDFPELDMVVISDGNRSPALSELCR
ncbi:MAG: hypothetical protein AAF604_19360 [Acidobacteriota bacterium]